MKNSPRRLYLRSPSLAGRPTSHSMQPRSKRRKERASSASSSSLFQDPRLCAAFATKTTPSSTFPSSAYKLFPNQQRRSLARSSLCRLLVRTYSVRVSSGTAERPSLLYERSGRDTPQSFGIVKPSPPLTLFFFLPGPRPPYSSTIAGWILGSLFEGMANHLR